MCVFAVGQLVETKKFYLNIETVTNLEEFEDIIRWRDIRAVLMKKKLVSIVAVLIFTSFLLTHFS